jgi:carbon monoxide dehydrogenase subunit G
VKLEVKSEVLAAPRERVWALLQDPGVLARLLPGVEKLEPIGPDEYSVVVKLGVGAVRGTYSGRVALRDLEPPERYRLEGDAKGGPGWAKGSATMTLEEQEGGTRLVAAGDAQIGGALAGVGQRMIEGVAKSMAREFFQSVGRELEGAPARSTSVSGFGWRVFLDLVRGFFARLFGRRPD